jgi:CubicO group peptidase (beta-lactamase class C family)
MKIFAPALVVLLLVAAQVSSQVHSLPRSTPEEQGVSSRGIMEFLNAVNQSSNEMHSLMIVRHGKVIAEGWWKPYRPDLKHTLYSLSKSFTSTAVGFAVAEKKLSVDDKVISFFPDKLPAVVSEHLRELTVKHLLSMTVGQAPDPSFLVARDTDWIRSFFAVPLQYKPGTVFLYNSMATYMLSAIVQKVSGQKLIDYLAPRLFKPLGIQGMDWENDPAGINVGGWGLRVKTEDIARFGQLYLQKGKWNDQQILPSAWIEEATSVKIDNAPGVAASKKDSSDWMQGYCYQFWRSRYNSYRGDGAFGQYMLILPEQDAVIAITSETNDMQDELNLVWKHLLPSFRPDPASLDPKDAIALKKQLSSLRLPLPVAADSTQVVPAMAAKSFTMQDNPKKIESISFREKGKIMTLTLKKGNTTYPINFGKGGWMKGRTSFHGPSLTEQARGHFVGLPPSQIAGTYYWKEQGVLVMQLRYIDSPHSLNMVFHIEDNKITADFWDSFAGPERKITLSGQTRNP